MRVLIVFAHPESQSFSAALKDEAVASLTRLGHVVVVSDLYAMRWDPVLDEGDFDGGRRDAEFLDVPREQQFAVQHGTQRRDVAAEQQKVADADFVLLHFPIWWYSMPAILKGWVDRVLASGFAYAPGEKYSRGRFVGKRAMLCITTGTASTLYEPNGIDGDLLHVLWPIHNGILAYCGFTVLPPFVAWMPGGETHDGRGTVLARYAERLTQLDSDEPLFFHPFEDYDDSLRLKAGVIPRSGVQWVPQDRLTPPTPHRSDP